MQIIFSDCFDITNVCILSFLLPILHNQAVFILKWRRKLTFIENRIQIHDVSRNFRKNPIQISYFPNSTYRPISIQRTGKTPDPRTSDRCKLPWWITAEFDGKPYNFYDLSATLHWAGYASREYNFFHSRSPNIQLLKYATAELAKWKIRPIWLQEGRK